jgi:UDPglucose--hexose-1-phosphate uridylyltransferase
MSKQLSEIRWNPIAEEWVAVAAHRQERPQMPKDWCPFCPGSGRVPEQYDVHIYSNDFATFSSPAPDAGTEVSCSLYKVAKAQGKCDVVLYHPDHNTSLSQLSVEHLTKLVKLWQQRYEELRAITGIKYIFIFENKGEVIGVTMPHPHGQIYSFPYVPPKIEIELTSCKKHWQKSKHCLLCDILQNEQKEQQRIVAQNNTFIAFVPFFARWPYEVHIYAKRHVQHITELMPNEVADFAAILKVVTQKYDGLFDFSFPYMMVMHQAPVDKKDYSYYHFHVEFYPPYRSKTKLKYLAGCESGAGTFINDTVPEEKAEELRNIQVTA